MTGRDTLAALRLYLDENEPKVARWLHDTWNAEAEAIKYQELRDELLAGRLSVEWLRDWQMDYSRLVIDKFGPVWLDAVQSANKTREEILAPWHFNPVSPAVTDWVYTHGSELAVNLAEQQHKALMLIIQRSASLGEFGPDELSRFIRPIIGMVPREAQATTNYYEWMLANGVPKKKADKKVVSYAARVHRHRAMRIARTELASAYNQGNHEGVRQAQEQGYIGEVQKQWLTAEDERVCPTCGSLDGTIVEQDELFPIINRLSAPAHPSCRCAVAYQEKKNKGVV